MKIYLMIKRLLDIIFSLVLLILLSPLFVIIAILVRAMSGSPIFFSYERMGRKGKPFAIYKFRSMVVGAKKLQAKGYSNDQVITKIGKPLRILHLDELPQLINILKGEMSFVGPRPLEREAYINYIKNNKKYHKNFDVRPGLTGFDSCLRYMKSEKRKDVLKKMQLKESSGLDRQRVYLMKISFLFDSKIIWWTLLLELYHFLRVISKKE